MISVTRLSGITSVEGAYGKEGVMMWMLLWIYLTLSLGCTIIFLAACVVSGRSARLEVDNTKDAAQEALVDCAQPAPGLLVQSSAPAPVH